MDWMWAVGAIWLVLGAAIALLIGRSIVLADKRSADHSADAPNFVVDRPPLTLLRKAPDTPAGDGDPAKPAADGTADRPTPPDTNRDAPTIPGLPVARPGVGRPAVPRSTRHRPHRGAGSG